MAAWEPGPSSSGSNATGVFRLGTSLQFPALLFPTLLFAALLFTALLSGCTWSLSETLSDSDDPEPDTAEGATGVDEVDGDEATAIGTVVFVIDGDTIDMEIDGQRERVRLLGIDAPESVSRSVPDQCFGAESSAALTELLPPGTELELIRDVEARDRFGRLLLYLYRADDGLFVNEWLVRGGFADTLFFEPNKTLASTLTEARGQARAEGAGLWGQCDGPDQPLE